MNFTIVFNLFNIRTLTVFRIDQNPVKLMVYSNKKIENDPRGEGKFKSINISFFLCVIGLDSDTIKFPLKKKQKKTAFP